MEVILKANTENILSVDETRALAAYIQALQQRLEKAEAEVAALNDAVSSANQRAHEADAAAIRIRAALGWAIAELTGVLTSKMEDGEPIVPENIEGKVQEHDPRS
ncbi:hypothetical protein [Azospirillum picis]|uniref:Nucleic acid-binding Zn-ribbon protein n=1 Tax=Azospirillum picis TaxID=488438 RepID=A0ABU0MT25_9PROT|nr:hypothetical protein [Azospirillum picis]MBP2302767.1 putative nucleic acid-binding Zn-ribbon protein [Azospirillum picis]MDQ0536571.1 putative nucleic acid-binding Zn-ribbon protein [Azospirillum picis]